MYGVPANLDLAFLHGAELIQVCLGQYQVQFHFHPVGSLSVEGDWELIGKRGATLDRNEPAPRSRPFQLHKLLGQRVAGIQVTAPDWIALRFDNGLLLRVFDSSKEFESFPSSLAM